MSNSFSNLNKRPICPEMVVVLVRHETEGSMVEFQPNGYLDEPVFVRHTKMGVCASSSYDMNKLCAIVKRRRKSR